MQIELTDEDAERVGKALLNLVRLYERSAVFDENEFQEYRKAYHAFDDAACIASEKEIKEYRNEVQEF